MLGPPAFRPPLPPCETRACVEQRREADTATVWALGLTLLAAVVAALALRARVRARARRAARRRQAVHDRAQDELTRLFDPPEAGATERRRSDRPRDVTPE